MLVACVLEGVMELFHAMCYMIDLDYTGKPVRASHLRFRSKCDELKLIGQRVLKVSSRLFSVQLFLVT
jgi:hypothetical protein